MATAGVRSRSLTGSCAKVGSKKTIIAMMTNDFIVLFSTRRVMPLTTIRRKSISALLREGHRIKRNHVFFLMVGYGAAQAEITPPGLRFCRRHACRHSCSKIIFSGGRPFQPQVCGDQGGSGSFPLQVSAVRCVGFGRDVRR
jgi:hypothetical protein